jgi:hypothetical protein
VFAATLCAGAAPLADRVIAYPGQAVPLPESPCRYARDLPLAAAAGARAIRTFGLLPDGDRVFQSVLESARLGWIAGFPVDPARSRGANLDAFRSYASRFRGEQRLLGWALDGPAADEYVEDAAAIVSEIDPVRPPAVLSGDRLSVEANFVGPGESDLFQNVPGSDGIPSLTPRANFYRLAGLWGGTYPAGWSEPARPRLDPADPASSTALIRLSGKALLNSTTPYSDETWPFHLGGGCLCIDGQPARLSFLGSEILTAQIPAALEPGQALVVFYRAGRASNVVGLHISEFSAGTRTGPILDARLR